MPVILVAALAAAVSPAPLIDLYATFCALDAGAGAAIERARRRGWAPMAATGVLQGVRDPDDDWTLKAGDQHVASQRVSSCGIETKRTEPDLATALQRWLGFAPALRLATSATFYAVLADGAFVDASRLDPVAVAAARQEGCFYSIMAVSTPDGASLFRLNVTPDRP